MEQRTFRLFISSTFADFITEREILNEKIAPAMRAYCGRFGYGFELVDLRWGVGSEAANGQRTLRICLNEIERCKKYSPRPYFFVMLGGRYGWTPLPGKLSKETFCVMRGQTSERDAALLDKWYKLDENEVGGAYVIQPRTGEYESEDLWLETEDRLREIIRGAIDRGPDWLADEVKLVSATEHEIQAGPMFGGMSSGTVAFFRKSETEEEQASQLKEKTRAALERAGYSDRTFELTEGEPDYTTLFEANVIERLKALTEVEMRRAGSDGSDEPDGGHADEQGFFGREAELAQLGAYVASDETRPLIVHGVSGCGKTTLLERYVVSRGDRCASVFFGRSDGEFTLVGAIKSLCEQLASMRGEQFAVSVSSMNVAEVLWKELRKAEGDGQATVIVLDGLDGFMEHEVATNVIPSTLPKGVKLIVSCVEPSFERLFGGSPTYDLRLGRVSEADGLDIVNWLLGHRGRTITPQTQQHLLEGACRPGLLPVHAMILAEIAAAWASYTVVDSVPATAEDAALRYMAGAFTESGHDKNLVMYALGLLCAAPYGLPEDDMMKLLLRIPEVRDAFSRQDRYQHNGESLPYAVWSRLYYDLRGCLETKLVKGAPVVAFRHQIFATVFQNECGGYCAKADAALREYYLEIGPYANEETRAPNRVRAINLMAMFQKMPDGSTLRAHLHNRSELDALLRTGEFDAVVSALTRLVSGGSAGVGGNRDAALLEFLLTNRRTLSCYSAELDTIAARCGDPVENGGHCSTGDTFLRRTPIPFIYDPDSGIAWSADDDRFVVWSGCWMYVCAAENGAEIARIFLQECAGGDEDVVGVAWDHADELVVCTSAQLLVFDASCQTPLISQRRRFDGEVEQMVVSGDRGMVAVLVGEAAIGVSLHTGSEVFRLENPPVKAICAANEEGAFACQHESGHLTRIGPGATTKHRVKLSVTEDYRLMGQLHNGAFVFADSYFGFAIAQDGKRDTSYVYPPYAKSMVARRLFGQLLICEYEHAIYVVDLDKDEEGKWFTVPHARAFAQKTTSPILAVVTDGNMVQIDPTLPGSCDRTIPVFASRKRLGNSGRVVSVVAGLARAWLTCDLAENEPRGWGRYDIARLEDSLDRMGGEDESLSLADRASFGHPSYIVVSPSGLRAVAYEEASAISVFAGSGQELTTIDTLRFRVDNALISMAFSDDSAYLAICRTKEAFVVDVQKAKTVFRAQLNGFMAGGIVFDGPTKILVQGVDGTELCFDIFSRESRDGADLGRRSWQADEEVAIYARSHEGDRPSTVVTAREGMDIEFHQVFSYFNGSDSLLYKDGALYLDGDEGKPVFAPYCDFDRCLREIRLGYETPLQAFIREKNELSSRLTRLDDRHVLLISKRLQSVLLIDTESRTLLHAYRHHGAILGYSLYDAPNAVRLFSDTPPYEMQLRLRF